MGRQELVKCEIKAVVYGTKSIFRPYIIFVCSYAGQAGELVRSTMHVERVIMGQFLEYVHGEMLSGKLVVKFNALPLLEISNHFTEQNDLFINVW